jgi:hypothetical protein
MADDLVELVAIIQYAHGFDLTLPYRTRHDPTCQYAIVDASSSSAMAIPTRVVCHLPGRRIGPPRR